VCWSLSLAGWAAVFPMAAVIRSPLRVVSGQVVLPWHAPISRFRATPVRYCSGIPGSAITGSGRGACFSIIGQRLGIPGEAIQIIALCMAGFRATVTQAPLKWAIIVMEMIDSHEMVISLMAVPLVAKAESSRLSPALHQQLALGFRPKNFVLSRKVLQED